MIAITTPDSIAHHLPTLPDGTPDFDSYTTSIATQNALATAYDAGHWQPYSLPEPELETPEPNWQGFRLALLQSATFRDWSEELPATWREDLKLAAIAANPEALQATYDHCVSLTQPGPVAAEWRDIAAQHHIPVVF